MEEEPKRAFLIKNIKLNNSKSRNSMSTNTLPIQELIIIEDKDNVKIMVTRPKDQWPENYFIIYDDQNFYYDRAYSGNVTPEDIRNKISQNPKGKNNCSKATNEGLL